MSILEEIKNHEFYMNGEAQIKKENQNLADMEKVEEYVIELIKETGKKFPLTGMLRGFSDWGFAFITDDTLFCSVQTHDNFSQPLLSNTKKYNSKATNESEIIFDQDFLQSKMGNAFDGEVQDYFRPFQVNQLKQFGVKFIKDI